MSLVNNKLILKAIATLAKMECPNFSGEPKEEVERVFYEVFEGFRPEKTWFDWFKLSVFIESGQKVQVRTARAEEFKYLIRGPGVYLALTRGEEKKKLFFGPYSTPFIFEE